MTVHLTESLRHAVPADGEPARMLPAEAYTSEEVLAWELRHLYAGSWTCLGREDELLPQPEDGKPTTQRAVRVGDVSAMLVRDKQMVRMFANTCRHRGHELLPEGESLGASQLHVPVPRLELPSCPASSSAPRGSRTWTASPRRSTRWSSSRWSRGAAGCSATPSTRWAATTSRRSPSTSASSTGCLAVPPCRAAARRPALLRGRRELEGDRGELPRVLPLPADPPRAVPGLAAGLRATTTTCRATGSAAAMLLRGGMRSMTLDGALAATPLPGVEPRRRSTTST